MRLKEVGLYKEKLQYFQIVIRQPFHYIIIVQPNRLEGFSVLLVATSGEFDSVSGFVEDQTWLLNCVARWMVLLDMEQICHGCKLFRSWHFLMQLVKIAIA